MQKISSKEIKNKFIEFFVKNGHMQIEDSSIIPKNDPTLLFVNSGMAPLKDFFTGAVKPPSKRLCDVQPCIRTIDIDSIGDKHHLTSFQMLGSWSIGDYFKEKAIYYAYTLLTEYIKIPKEKLYVTVFSGDEELNIPMDKEAYDCWIKVGVPEDHIIQCGKEDNFWGPTSETGPCGPCTEIFFDTGDGKKYVPGEEFDTKSRYIEIWNAGVFMQFNKNADGSFSKLAFNSVDTGAGLERLAMVLGGYDSVYQTDLLLPIKKRIEKELEGKGKLQEREVLILTDHLRTASVILSEKVVPSNEGRGYTPRKLIRRCMMITYKNKIFDFNFSEIVKFILEEYKDIFPHFKENYEFIIKELEKECTQFGKVLSSGLERLENIKEKAISTDTVFDLVTTYGLPFDIVKQYAIENNLEVNEEEFRNKIEEHKEKSKNVVVNEEVKSLNSALNLLDDCKTTVFMGYEVLSCEGVIQKIIKEGKIEKHVSEGENALLVLNKSCFYAQSGGQCGDSGYIYSKNFKFRVSDVKKNKDGVFVHIGVLENGEINQGDEACLTVDEDRRNKISCNHTAVHLLQSALRKIFGEEVHQAGSNVEENKLRFDFNYENQIKETDIYNIEKIVNSLIRRNIERNVKVQELSEAIASGAMALFESKYKDKVRVVSYADVSKELCGGTHTSRTGNIGLFIITSVEGIGKGMKRVTAVTGEEALEFVQNKIKDVAVVSKLYKVKPEDMVLKVTKEFEKVHSKNKESKEINLDNAKYLDLCPNLKFGYIVLNESSKKLTSEIIKKSDEINGLFLCIVSNDDKKQVTLAISDKLQERYKANEILRQIMTCFNGKGGGNKKIATGVAKVSEIDLIKKLKNICVN